MGRLAVSSTIPAEIYLGNKNLGSTPTTVQLPAGRQTLEYRHGDLRTVVNHTIKPNETISAAITFQVTVQINAKPWAQVFLEGTPRRPLGQTPLSGITVPVSSVLVFENPNFPSKTYRVTEKDTAVQVNFP
jgi:PEGA domain-containing protein